MVLPADVTDAGSFAGQLRSAAAEFGGLDLCVYCAGVYTDACLGIDLPLVRQTIEINLLGVYNLLDPVVPLLRRNRCRRICLVSSVAGYSGLPKRFGHGPGKAALNNPGTDPLHRSCARGIGVYLVNPGFVATRLTRRNDFRMPSLMTPTAPRAAMIAGLGGASR